MKSIVLGSAVLLAAVAAALSAGASGQDQAGDPQPQASPQAEHLLLVLEKSGDAVSLLDPESGERVARVPVGVGPHEAAVSHDGRIAVVCNYGGRGTPGRTLSVIDVPRREVTRTLDLGEHTRPHGIAFFSDGRRVAVTTEGSKRLLVVDVESGAIEAAVETGQEISHMVALSPNERLAFVTNIGSHSVSVIDLEKGEQRAIVPTGLQAEGVAVHPAGEEVWITNRMGNSVSILSVETLEVLEQLECGQFPIRVAFTPDGVHALVSCARSGDVAVFRAASRQRIARIPMELDAVEREELEQRLFGLTFGDSPVPIGLLVSPDGRRAFVANTNADIVTVIDTATWKVVDRFAGGREPDGLAWSTVEADAKDGATR